MITMFFPTLETIFGYLLTASWQASVLAVLILGIQRCFRSWLNPRWSHALWLLVIARLILPVLPESQLSLFQWAPTNPPILGTVKDVSKHRGVALPRVESLPEKLTKFDPVAASSLSLYSMFAMIWLGGVIVLSILTGEVNRRFSRQMTYSSVMVDSEILTQFYEVKKELGIKRSIRIIETEHVHSPALMGLFTPTLLLPRGVKKNFDGTELRLIFLHELAHLKRGDLIVQILIAVLQILHWFNPVLWFAFRRMRMDREPATDALVLSYTNEAEQERYGMMLLKLVEHFNQRHALSALVGILEDKDQIKRRFSLIARFTKGAYGWSLLGLILMGVLTVTCLTTSSTQGQRQQTKGQPTTKDQPQKEGLNPDQLLLKPFKVEDITLPDLVDVLCKNMAEVDPNTKGFRISLHITKPKSEQMLKITYEQKEKRKTLLSVLEELSLEYPLHFYTNTPLTAVELEYASPGNSEQMTLAKNPADKTPREESVMIQMKLVEIQEDKYQTHKREIDDMVTKGGVAMMRYFDQLEGVNLLAAPSVTTTVGQKATVDMIQECPYPTDFQPPQDVKGKQYNGSPFSFKIPITPVKFSSKDIGLSVEFTTMHDPTRVIIQGNLRITKISGMTQSNLGIKVPSFETTELPFIEAMDENKDYCLWVPGLDYDPIPNKNNEDAATVKASTYGLGKRRLVIIRENLISS